MNDELLTKLSKILEFICFISYNYQLCCNIITLFIFNISYFQKMHYELTLLNI